MSKRIGSVYLELDKKMTESSFKGLQGIVNKVANDLKPITLKLNVKETTKEFNELTKVLKDVATNINKINSSTVAAGGGSALARQANEVKKAYQDIMSLQKKIGNLEIKLSSGNKGPTAIAEMTAQLEKLKQKRDELQAAFSSRFTSTQAADIAKQWEEVTDKIKLANAEMADKKAAQEAAAAQKAAAAAAKQAAKDEAQAAKEQARAEKEAANAEKERTNSLRTLYNLLKQVQTLEGKIANGRGGTGSASFQGLSNLETQIKDIIATGGTSTEQVKQLQTVFAQYSQAANEAGDATSTFDSGLSELETRILSMVSLASILTAAMRQLKQMISTTIELDDAMTNLRIVTNNTETEYQAYGKQMAKTAQEIGVSITDLVDSTTVFARLGYSLSESSNLSELTSMLSKVGDIDVSSAQSALTAITKAFNIAGDEVETAMDKMVVVGNRFPISVSELATGMNNAGSALASAGNSFEQSIALLMAANATVQNASKSSRGMRTIAARIRNVKTELDELGETVNEAKYQEVLDILTGKGVSLTENGEFRSTYDILKDIANIWDELDSMSQASIVQQLAGTNQQNIFYSLIGQFQEAERAMQEMAENSSGALAEAYGERMESVTAHLDTFKAAYQEMSSSFIDEDMLKGIIDFGTSLLNILTKVSDVLGGMKSLAPAVFGTAATFIASFSKSESFTKLLSRSGLTDAAGAFKAIGDAIAQIGKLKINNVSDLFSGISGIFSKLPDPARIGLTVSFLTALAAVVYQLATMPTGLDKATNNVTELESSLSNVETELARNKTKIDELNQVKGTSAWTAQQEIELNNLLAQNAALEAQKTLLEQRDSAARKNQEKEAIKLANELTGETHTSPHSRSLTDAATSYQRAVESGNKLAMQFWADYLTTGLDKAKQALDVLDPEENKKEVDALNTAIIAVNTALGMMTDEAGDTAASVAETADAVKAATDEIDKLATPAERASNSLKRLWNSEDFSEAKDELIALAKAEGSISADNIIELASKNETLASIMETTGISARFLANVLSQEALNGNGFDLITDKALRVDAAMQAIIDRTAGAKAAIDAFNAATSTDNADAASSYAQAYQKFFADWDAGRTGSTAVQAAVNTFFSADQLEQIGWDLQTAGEQLSSKFFQAVFSTEGDPGANFATYVRDHYTEAWQDAVEITENADGTFDIAVTSAQALADAMGVDINVANAFIEAMGAWGTHLFATGEELENLATELGLVGDNASNVESVVNAINSLALDGLDGTQIKATLDALSDAGYIDTSGIDDLDGKITDAVEKYNALDSTTPDVEVTTNLDEVDSHIDSTQKKIDGMHGKHIVNTIEDRHVTTGGAVESAQASGTKNAPGGRTLVNELGPELISQNGHAFIANGGKPAVVNLDKGAVVLNAADTRSALRGGGISGVIGAMASGSRATFPTNYNPGGGGGGGGSSSKSSSSSSSSNSSSTTKEKTWFEQQYAYHKHLVEMDQELQSDFLDWLDEAYKKAYAEGIIDLEEYMSKEAEVYKGRQDQFKDYISDLDYAIDMAKKAGANSEDVANMYQKMLDEINRALEIAFARGLDENDDYVQYLQNQWYNYYDSLKEAREDAQDDAMDAVDDLVQYRIKMLKQYIKNEVDSLKERLSNLKDFYSKQKDLLKDVADTEDYLDEQAEKRKSVTDIESQLAMLDLDNSAWAQKRKAKLKEELADAQKELNKFERDHAIEVASDQLDAAYEVQERAINARIDELNDLADNPKALYDRALSDVRNNSVALYEEMIEFNNLYGDGIRETIVTLWQDAYVALKNYSELYHEFYNGIDLVNATGYQPGAEGNVGGNYIARNPGGSAIKVAGVMPAEISDSGTASAYSDLDPAVQAQIEAAQAAMQAQLDAVMNNIQAATNSLLDQVTANTQATLSNLTSNYALSGVNMGDIIIQGNATMDTVSEIRRAQRDNISNMLKAFNTLNNK